MEKNKKGFLVVLGLIVSLGALLRIILIWTNGEQYPRFLALIADDAYFVPQIARNIVLGNGPALDGYTPTNGFHPLWLLFLLPIYKIFGNNILLALQAALTLQMVFGLLTIYLLGKVAYHFTRSYSAVFLTVIFYYWSYPVLQNEISLFESALLALIFSCIVYFMVFAYRYDLKRFNKDDLILGSLCGALMLTRTDHFFVAGSILCGLLMRYPKWYMFKRAFLAGIVSVAVVSPWLIWSMYYFGSVVQGSSITSYALLGKLIFLRQHDSYMNAAFIIEAVKKLIYVWCNKKTIVFLLFPLCAGLYMIKKDAALKEKLPAVFFVLLPPVIGVMIMLAYHGIARWHVNDWYWVCFHCSAIVFSAVMISFLVNRLVSGAAAYGVAAGIALLFVISNVMIINNRGILTDWIRGIPRIVARQALAVKDFNEGRDDRWGGISIGAISYLSGRSVNSLDGTTNNPVIPFIKQGRLSAYIKDNRIRYIIRYEELAPYITLGLMGENILEQGEKFTIQSKHLDKPLNVIRLY